MHRPQPALDQLEPRLLCAAAGAAASADWSVPGPPDLTVRFARSPKGSGGGTFLGGTQTRAAVVVRNAPGAAATAPSSVSLYLSADGTLDPSDRQTAWAQLPSLSGGAQVRLTFRRLTLSVDAPAGTYRLLARADDAGVNAESDESNNDADGGVMVVKAPVVDLAVVAIRGNLYYYKGTWLNGGATLRVRNNGNTAYTGPVTITAFDRFSPYHHWTFTEQVSVKRGRTARVSIPLEHRSWAAEGSEVLYFFRAAGHNDVTPDEELAGDVKVVYQ